MPLSSINAVCVGENLTGHTVFCGFDTETSYRIFRFNDMMNEHIYRNLSSAVMWPPTAKSIVYLIMFKPIIPWFTYKNFQGSFMQMKIHNDADQQLEVPQFGNYGFDNCINSMFLMRVDFPDSYFWFPVSFRDMMLNPWNQSFNAISDAIDIPFLRGIKQLGNPTFTWDMWPTSGNGLNSSSRYLKVKQRFNIDIGFWSDYEASISAWIYLYLDLRNRIRGKIAKTSCWVEGGILHNLIKDNIDTALSNNQNQITTEINNQLNNFEDSEFKRIDYLPGRQLGLLDPNGWDVSWLEPIITGSTFSDVTIMLLHE